MATIPTGLERLGYGSPDGCIATGQHRQVISGESVATRTLKPKESGALVLMDRAAGIVFTLPTPAVGMEFEFLATVAVTSNAYEVHTDGAATFLLGAVLSGEDAAAMDTFEANGTSIIAIASNGTTTGGLIGSHFKVTALSSTVWGISGVLRGSGTLATPFSAS